MTSMTHAFNMHTSHNEIDLGSDDALLNNLLAEMGEGDELNDDLDLEAGSDEMIELDDDGAIEAAIADIEKAEAVQALYVNDEAAETIVTEADTPLTDADAPLPNADAKVKKAKTAKAPKVAKAPKEPKAPSAPRITYVGHKASEVLTAKLGGNVSDMLVLETADAALEPAALEAKQAELLSVLNMRPGSSESGSTQKKVAEKVVQLFSYMANGGTLNEVMRRAFSTLAQDGELTTGDKGNLHAALLAKPYSLGTCRAQAGQIIALFPMLKIAMKTEKGKLVANPDSMIFMKMRAELGL